MTATQPATSPWTRERALDLFALPLNDLLFEAQQVHRRHFEPNRVQLSTLLSVKTGGCPEDCAYCPQSVHHDTGLEPEPLMPLAAVRAAAEQARTRGAGRFCMGAAWRNPKGRQFERLLEMVREVKALGLETCVTAGMLTDEQARALKGAGLDYYNHNLDSSPEFYGEIITTRTYEDRLETLAAVRAAQLKVCCGGIVGMGERREDRAGLLVALAGLRPHPESVPINRLVQVSGTPLEGLEELDGIEFVRTVAAARIMLPTAVVRLSAGRETMSDELQALCFLAGANSLFLGERLLTTGNPDASRDQALFERLGIQADASVGAADLAAAGASAAV